ncbi:MAG: hypothetical protein PHQ57_00580 [Candidatus Omnitrophica bacterium]|nr:hypothetical protein [Candidatus Omnitrophota bacterium]
MKKMVRMGLIIGIILLAVLSAWLAIQFDKSRRYIENLQSELGLERKQIVSLKKDFSSTKDELDKVRLELDNTLKDLNDVNNKLKTSESNNTKLLAEKKVLESRLHSLRELRKAVREVKQEMWQQRYEEYLSKKEMQKQIDAAKLAQGNRGFCTKEGKTTYKPSIKIEVRPGN